MSRSTTKDRFRAGFTKVRPSTRIRCYGSPVRDLVPGHDPRYSPDEPPLDEALLAATYADDERPPPPGRPWVALDMVTSADGAATLDGRSAGLSSPGDRAVFRALRAVADVVLVGAGTVRAERYGPPRIAPELVELRQDRQQAPQPQLAVVSASLDLDPDLAMFTAEGPTGSLAPLLITCSGGRNDTSQRDLLSERAEVIDAGDGRVDLARALGLLAERGARVVVCEGGPSLNAELLAVDLVDELCCTVAPVLVGGHSGRIVGAHRDIGNNVELTLDRLMEHEDSLFARWLVNGRRQP